MFSQAYWRGFLELSIMLHLYHLNNSRSFRVVWLLEELKLAYDLEYQLHLIERDKKTFLAPKNLEQIHPMGKAPILIDDRLPKGEQVLAESALILSYLLKAYDSKAYFYPAAAAPNEQANDKVWRDYTFWMHFAEGSVMPPLVMGLILDKARQKSPWFVKPVLNKFNSSIHQIILDKNLMNALKMLETALSDKLYLTGQFSAADIQMYLAVYGARLRGLIPQTHTNTHAWLGTCEGRQGFKSAISLADSPL
ncbi:glutathione S-transferase [Moraxella catarrhalis]|uniref:glutathione S-transferase n=1 Tax=Moraxella catarrhalis TaxID=480 RepID=UPI001DFD555B|nr:glutathione S-transferase [Moraxella catarrhalis]MPY07302.1 glutathione S-transferase [Moraxella catarrhalis]